MNDAAKEIVALLDEGPKEALINPSSRPMALYMAENLGRIVQKQRVGLDFANNPHFQEACDFMDIVIHPDQHMTYALNVQTLQFCLLQKYGDTVCGSTTDEKMKVLGPVLNHALRKLNLPGRVHFNEIPSLVLLERFFALMAELAVEPTKET